MSFKDIQTYLTKHNIPFTETESLVDEVSQADVLYQTRIQQERFDNADAYMKHKGVYQIDASLASQMKEEGIIMHPLPRVDEILPEVDSSPLY